MWRRCFSVERVRQSLDGRGGARGDCPLVNQIADTFTGSETQSNSAQHNVREKFKNILG